MSSESQQERPRVKQALITTAFLAAGVVVLFLLWHLSQILLVVFAGVMLAVFLDSLANWLGRYLHCRRSVALLLVIVVLLSLLVSTGWVVGPRIAEQFARLSDKIPAALQSVRDSIAGTEWGRKLLAEMPSTKDLLPVGSDILGRVTGVFSSAVGMIVSVVIIVFVGFYLAISPEQYRDNLVRLVPKNRRPRAREVLAALGEVLRWWMAGRFAAMIIIGILVSTGLWIAGVPLALTLGFITAVLAFIPYIGPVLSVIPMVLVALAEEPVLVIWVLVLYAGVQLLETYLITPMVQKQFVFIPPALLITVQILMSVLFGLMGMLLATPLALVAVVLIQMLYVEDVLNDKVKVLGHHD